MQWPRRRDDLRRRRRDMLRVLDKGAAGPATPPVYAGERPRAGGKARWQRGRGSDRRRGILSPAPTAVDGIRRSRWGIAGVPRRKWAQGLNWPGSR
ncbi:hypothetical protein MTO96_016851 [Rhipicephalus appendiculatus]